MNLYANWLHDVGKLVYIIGNFSETAQLKKILDPADPRFLDFNAGIAFTSRLTKSFQTTHCVRPSCQGFARES